jgi:hypothetical protein
VAAERGADSWDWLENDKSYDIKRFRGIASMGNMIEGDDVAMEQVFLKGAISALEKEVNAKKGQGGECIHMTGGRLIRTHWCRRVE